MNVKELKTLLKENKTHFYTYWDKNKLLALANDTIFYQRQSLKRKKVRMLIMID